MKAVFMYLAVKVSFRVAPEDIHVYFVGSFFFTHFM